MQASNGNFTTNFRVWEKYGVSKLRKATYPPIALFPDIIKLLVYMHKNRVTKPKSN